jgi:hypothetical protein
MSRQIPVKRDKRISVVREMLQNIVAVKLNAWDDRFIRRASASRDEELRLVSFLPPIFRFNLIHVGPVISE